jgi:hypothetical protein
MKGNSNREGERDGGAATEGNKRAQESAAASNDQVRCHPLPF